MPKVRFAKDFEDVKPRTNKSENGRLSDMIAVGEKHKTKPKRNSLCKDIA